MNNHELYLIIDSSIKFVKGATRTSVCDHQRGKIYFVPNDMFDFVEKFNRKQIKFVYEQLDKEDVSTGQEYIKYLIDNEFAFLGDLFDTTYFSEIESNWNHPGTASNAIIELSLITIDGISNLLQQLNGLGCIAIQFISYSYPVTPYDFDKILDALREFGYPFSIDFVIPFHPEFNETNFEKLFYQNLNISRVLIHSCNEINEKIKADELDLVYTNQRIDSPVCCGEINMNYFTLNLPQIIEAKQYNSCLHQKITIDKEGNIKNCLAFKKNYGNIKSDRLKDTIQKKDFQQFWDIDKSKIEGCNTCEFRLVCTDCRALTEDPENIYSKPLKCGYDPLTNIWNDWDSSECKRKVFEKFKLVHN